MNIPKNSAVQNPNNNSNIHDLISIYKSQDKVNFSNLNVHSDYDNHKDYSVYMDGHAEYPDSDKFVYFEEPHYDDYPDGPPDDWGTEED